jgi:thioredoxin-dependent peroxiredoxin
VTVALGQIAPDFEQDTINGSIRFHEWIGGYWCVFFSHTAFSRPDHDPELAEAIRLKPEWDRRGIKLIGLSADAADIRVCRKKGTGKTQSQSLNFPVVADTDRRVVTLYGMTGHPMDRSLAGRNVFVLDRQRKVRLLRRYPPSSGRSFAEILCVVDTLQTADAPTPADSADPTEGGRITSMHPLPGTRTAILPTGRTPSGPRLRPGDRPSGPYQS